MTVRVTFIGSGNAFADGGRSHACIHVSAPGVSLLLDCGGASLPAIKREIDPEAIDAIAISHLVKHVPEADPHGLRVRVGDKLVAYSGDAAWSDDLVHVAKGADLFICDATYFDLDEPAHISYRTLMSHRDALDCKRIVLTHLGAETLARIGELELEHAVDGTIIEVG